MPPKPSKSKTNKEKTIETLDNGLVFEGEIKDGEWHGEGIVSHPDGFRHE